MGSWNWRVAVKYWSSAGEGKTHGCYALSPFLFPGFMQGHAISNVLSGDLVKSTCECRINENLLSQGIGQILMQFPQDHGFFLLTIFAFIRMLLLLLLLSLLVWVFSSFQVDFQVDSQPFMFWQN
jgi:hypothetical protein